MPRPSSPTPHRFEGPDAVPDDDEDGFDDRLDGDHDGGDRLHGDHDGGDRGARDGGWDRDLLVARYGRSRAGELLALVTGRPAPHRRIGVVPAVLAVVVAVGLTYALWAYRSETTGTVGATLVRLDTVSDTSILVTWTVSRDPGTTVACDVAATGDSGAQVGVREKVTIAPGTDRAVQVVTEVHTTGRGLNATVDRCQRITPVAPAAPAPTG